MDVREKGHRFERYIVSILKSIGFSKASTTRQSNRLLDSCGVDIDRVPYYIQCKNGYTRGINYSKLIKDIHTRLKNEYDKVDYPIIVLHKKSSKYEDNLAILPLDDLINILKQIELQRQTRD